MPQTISLKVSSLHIYTFLGFPERTVWTQYFFIKLRSPFLDSGFSGILPSFPSSQTESTFLFYALVFDL